MAYYLLKCFYDLGTDRYAELSKTEVYRIWMGIGGDRTSEAFRGLGRSGQKAVLDYMETFYFFREAEVNGRRFFLSHTVPDKSKMLDFISAGSGQGDNRHLPAAARDKKAVCGKWSRNMRPAFYGRCPSTKRSTLRTDTS